MTTWMVASYSIYKVPVFKKILKSFFLIYIHFLPKHIVYIPLWCSQQSIMLFLKKSTKFIAVTLQIILFYSNHLVKNSPTEILPFFHINVLIFMDFLKKYFMI